MIEDKIIRIAFIISLAGHCLFLGMPLLGLNLPISKEDKELTVQIEIEIPPPLPKIEVMGEKKKIKEVVEEPKLPESKPELQAEDVIVEELKLEPSKELVEVINPQPEPEIQPEEAVIANPIPEHPKEVVAVIDSQDEAMLRYQDMVKQRIEEARGYPSSAKRQGFEGKAYLKFVILSNGIAQEIRVLRSSGFKILDEEAITTIRRAEPFPPIPKGISTLQVQMEIAIVFKLK